ncbi:hypothetical protein FACS18949_18400 [Clostridia bacterium]|nr:hypothetical protein FACS189425_07210 [Clostridia bacterium]GHV38152.1 hypothetical protein FACS18949_18400 [Clostridia bacterium]
MPSHTLVCYTNYLPKVRSMDSGTWSRIKLLPFEARITNVVPNYTAELTERCGGYILQWAIDGAKMFHKQSYTLSLPEFILLRTEQYQEQNDWFKLFFEDRFERCEYARISCGLVHRLYGEWCEEMNEFKKPLREVNREFERRGFERVVTKTGKYLLGLIELGQQVTL